MDEVGAIGKNQTNSFDKYKFRGIDDVYNAIHPALVKHGVFVVPRLVDCQRDELQTKNATMQHASVRVEYEFFASDGSSVLACAPGEGADRGDKAINKAMSAAYKTAMFQTFCIPTAEASDSEHDSPDLSSAPALARTTGDTGTRDPAVTPPADIDTRPDGFYFQAGSEPPAEPNWSKWREDVLDKSKNDYIRGNSWGWVAEGSFGGQRYHFCRKIADWDEANEQTKLKALNCIWDIERAALLDAQAQGGAF